MVLLLHALSVVETVSLRKLADAMPTAVDKGSNLRRLQRFFAKYVLDFDQMGQSRVTDKVKLPWLFQMG